MTPDPDGRTSRPRATPSPAGRRRKSAARGKDAGMGGHASWTSSVINLVNTIVGAGVLAMPRAMSQMGMLLGCFVILWSGLTAGLGLYLQTRCARYLDRGQSSFFALSQITYPGAAVVFDAAIAVKCFGVGVSYLIIIGDLMPGVCTGINNDWTNHFAVFLDRKFWITAFMLVVIPLSFLRRLDSLRYTSIVALVAIGYLIILVLAHFSRGDTLAEKGNVRFVHWAGPVQALSSLPVIIFAYTCHQNMFSILNEIGNNSKFRTTAVVVASITVAASIYILVAITGYLSFGDNVRENIVAMYAPSTASTIGKVAIVVLVMFSYPLQVHPCRASVDAVLRWRPWKDHSSLGSSPPRPRSANASSSRLANHGADAMSDLRFAFITTIIIVLSYLTAITVSSLERVLAYVGSTGSTSISFILPGLFYYKISAPESVHHQRLLKESDDESDDVDDAHVATSSGAFGHRSWQRRLLRQLSLALAAYGAVIMVVCLATNTLLAAAH